MFDAQQIVTIIQQTGGTISQLITQIAFFFAVQAASQWLSFSLPCLLLFSVLLKIAKSQKSLTNEGASERAGLTVFFAWLFFSASLFTGVRGISHIVQASLAPIVYVTSEIGGIEKLIEGAKK